MASADERDARLRDRVTLAGAGKMGGALLRGWLARGLDPALITVVEPHADADLTDLCRTHRIAINSPETAPATMLVLAIKPQTLTEAAPSLRRIVGPDTLLVSILAGQTIADLSARLAPVRAVVRAMPNLPASIGAGATGAVASPEVSPTQRAAADALLGCVGLTIWLDDESLIDAVTAVSGSGPAYVALLTETLMQAGIVAGLPQAVAADLARATLVGTAALLAQDPREPDRLRLDVTSPGGTTAAALDVLMRPGGLPDLMREAVAAAKRRAGELAG